MGGHLSDLLRGHLSDSLRGHLSGSLRGLQSSLSSSLRMSLRSRCVAWFGYPGEGFDHGGPHPPMCSAGSAKRKIYLLFIRPVILLTLKMALDADRA